MSAKTTVAVNDSENWEADMAPSTWQETADMLEDSGTLTSWKPEPGESIGGRVLTIVSNTGKEGDSSLAEIETENSERMGVWLSTVLMREFEQQKVAPGDVVGIKYFGKKTSKAGHEYNAYGIVIIESAGSEFDDDIPF